MIAGNGQRNKTMVMLRIEVLFKTKWDLHTVANGKLMRKLDMEKASRLIRKEKFMRVGGEMIIMMEPVTR